MPLELLYKKPARNAPMVAVTRATATAGLGLVGDVNASSSSPRQVLLACSGTLSQLAVTPGDLRANLVVDIDVDRLPSGTILRVGDVHIRLTLACEPCHKLETIRTGLARDTYRRRGMLGRIIAGGVLQPGDEVSVAPATLPALEDTWQARVADILAHLPADKHITFARLAEVAGVQSSYCRAFPSLLRRLAGTGLPIERVISGSSRDTCWDGASYFVASEQRRVQT